MTKAGFLGVMVLGLAGCGHDPGDLWGTSGGSGPMITGASSSSGTGGASAASSSSAGGAGGAGGLPCVPDPEVCDALACGEVADGCGHMVTCGPGCASNQVCTGGACCTPKAACDVHHCGTEPDGCGGEIVCDASCGGNTWLHCEAGTCACSDAHDWMNPDPDKADKACGGGAAPKDPWYCGNISNDLHVPSGCQINGFGTGSLPAPSGTFLWCCLPPTT